MPICIFCQEGIEACIDLSLQKSDMSALALHNIESANKMLTRMNVMYINKSVISLQAIPSPCISKFVCIPLRCRKIKPMY